MPYYYFAKNGEKVELEDVERKFLESINEPREIIHQLGNFSWQFEILCTNGLLIFWNGEFNQSNFDKLYEKGSAARWKDQAMNFYCGEYQFVSYA